MSTNPDEEGFLLKEMTWQEVEDSLAETSTMLLPVGSTEQHGHHMPLGVDVYMPEAVGKRAAALNDCLLAPPIWYGVSPHHTFKPGTFTINSETFQGYVRDVCRSAGDWGVENVLLLNGHYLAQDPDLRLVVRKLRNEHGLRAFHIPLIEVFRDAAERVRSSGVAFHAAEFETSCMLALRPDLVHLDQAVTVDPPDDPLPLTGYDALKDVQAHSAYSSEDMAALTKAGNVGDPTVATREKGEKLLTEAVQNVVDLIEALEAEG